MKDKSMRIGSLFAGIGGLELGLEWSGLGHVVWQVENDEFCSKVLAKHWPEVERFGDVRTVGVHNLPRVDVLCGGFPCQDISSAGKGEGLAGERSGLWFEFARIVKELRPRWVVVENVASGASRWVDQVRAGMEQRGYETLPVPISAQAVGAPHRRARVFIVAHTNDPGEHARPIDAQVGELQKDARRLASHTDSDSIQLPARRGGRAHRKEAAEPRVHGEPRDVPDTQGLGRRTLKDVEHGERQAATSKAERGKTARAPVGWWHGGPPVSPVRLLDDGSPTPVDRVAQLRALGNGVVPQCSEVIGHVIQELERAIQRDNQQKKDPTMELKEETKLQHLALVDIAPSPTQPRTQLGDIADLAQSIKVNGVLQPVAVRYTEGREPPYEMAFGHRRHAACEQLGTVTIPALVIDRTDEEIGHAQLVENLQREGLHYMDEVEGYLRLVDVLGEKPEKLAKAIGKSPAYIYARLNLRSIPEAFRQFIREHGIGYSVALVLARVPQSMQMDACKAVIENGRPMAFRDAQWTIENQFTVDLSTAVFSKTSTKLFDGCVPCSGCPQYAGNDDQYDILCYSKKAICLDRECFKMKTDATFAKEAKKAAKHDTVIVEGKKAAREFFPHGSTVASSKTHVELTEVHNHDPEGRTLAKLIGNSEATHLVKDPQGRPRLFIERSKVSSAVANAGHEFMVAQAKPKKPGERPKAQRAREEVADLAVGRALAQGALAKDTEQNFLHSVATVMASVNVPEHVLELLDIDVADGDPDQKLSFLIDNAKAPALRKIIVAMLYDEAPTSTIDVLAEEYSVDVDVVRIEAMSAAVAP